MSMLANQVPVEALNMAMTQLMPDSNVVVLAMLPDNGEFVIPTEAQLADAMKRVAAENIEAYVDEVKSEPLIAAGYRLVVNKIAHIAHHQRSGCSRIAVLVSVFKL